MKIATVFGTRPEIIRLSCIIEQLDGLCEHVLIHTGQNYNKRLSDLFFDELGVRAPDYFLNARGSFGQQVGTILSGCGEVFAQEKPDGVLILGDTNSALGALVAKRLGIPVFHMEAGNRCYDDRVPEEVNRRVIDHASDVLMPYTERSRMNLLREGVANWRVFVIGNPIFQVLTRYAEQISSSQVLSDLELEAAKYFLVTMHRAENVDLESRLQKLTQSLLRLREEHELPVIVSTHPRTRQKMEAFGLDAPAGVRFLEPFGLFDFVALEQSARCVLSDSGTVQEECCIFHIPNVTLRDVTERPETVECGSNILSGVEPDSVVRSVNVAIQGRGNWTPPEEYLNADVSSTVVQIVLGYHCPRIR